MMTLEMMLWIFLIYAFLGWCVEVIYGTAVTGKFVNRGFLSGPVCPIYGLGMLIILVTIEPFQENIGLLFLVSMILTSVLELVVGIILHRVFQQRWWDYREFPLNLGGYICLKFSLAWGLGSVLVLKVLHPLVENLLKHLVGNQIWLVILIVSLIILVIDAVATFNRMLKIRKQLLLIDDIDYQIQQLSNKIGVRLHLASKKTMSELERRRQERDQLLEKLTSRSNRLIKSFPDSSLAQWIISINKSINKRQKK